MSATSTVIEEREPKQLSDTGKPTLASHGSTDEKEADGKSLDGDASVVNSKILTGRKLAAVFTGMLLSVFLIALDQICFA